MFSKLRLIPTLGFLGLIPFLSAVLLTLAGLGPLGLERSTLFIGYSAMILAFLSGSLWGEGLRIADSFESRVLLISSNLFAVVAWVGLGLNSIDYLIALTVLGMGYALILFLEYQTSRVLYSNCDYPYLSLRARLTFVVLSLHAYMGYLIV